MHVQYVYTASEWFSPPGAEKDVVLHLGISHTQAVPPVTQTRCSSPQHINTSNIDISEAPPTGSTLCFSNNKSANQEGAGSRKSYSIHERRPWRQEPNQEQCFTLERSANVSKSSSSLCESWWRTIKEETHRAVVSLHRKRVGFRFAPEGVSKQLQRETSFRTNYSIWANFSSYPHIRSRPSQ